MVASIVVPLPAPDSDRAEVSAAAIPFARALAARTGAAVTLVTVLEPASMFSADPPEDQRQAEAEANLRRIAADFPGSTPETVVRSGNAVNQILDLTQQLPDPVIVMASRGRGGLDRLLRGSFAFRLVHKAPCPVLVVRATEEESAADRTPSFEKILIPLDRSAFAEQAMEAALDILGDSTLHVHLVHVVDPSEYLGHPPAEARALGERIGNRYLREVAERLVPRGHHVTTEVRYGRPTTEIVRAATEQDVDLIAMATHGRGAVGWFFLGSAAESLLREARLPLLLVRPDEEAITAETAAPPQDEELAPPAIWSRPVSELMTPLPSVAQEETPLEDVVQAMLTHRIGAMPVVDADNHLVGIITTSDLTGHDPWSSLNGYQVADCFQHWVDEGVLQRIRETGQSLTAGQIMSQPVVVAKENEPIATIVRRMLSRDLNRVLVVRDGVPVGLVARLDLLKLLLPDDGGERPRRGPA